MRDHHLLRPPRLSTAWLTSAGVTFFMDLSEPSGSVSNALSTGTGDRGYLGVFSGLGMVTPDSTYQRISSFLNTLLPLSWLWWPQDLKHSLAEP